MAQKLASLVVDLSVNSAELRKGLNQAKAAATSFAQSVSTQMNAAFSTIDKAAKQLKRATNEMAQAGLGFAAMAGAAVALASTVDSSIAKQLRSLKDSLIDLAVPIAQLVIPAMKDLGEWIRRAADFVAGLSPHMKALIANFVEISAVVGGAALVISKVAAAVEALAGILALVTAAPLLEVLAVLAAVAVAALFLHKVWRENWGGIQKVVKDVMTDVRGYIGQAFDAAIDIVGGFIRDTADGFIILVNAAQAFAGLLGVDVSKAADLGREIAEWTKHLTTKQGFHELLDEAGAFVTKVKDGLVDAASAMGDELKIVLASLKGALNFSDGAAKRFHPLTDAELAAIQGQLGQFQSGGISGAGKVAITAQAQDTLIQALSGAIKKAGDATAADFDDWVQKGPFRSAGAALGQALGLVGEQLRQFADGLAAATMSVIGKLGGAGEIINAGLQGLSQGGPMGAIVGVIAAVITKLEAFQRISDSVNKYLEKSLALIDHVIGPFVDTFITMSEAFSELTMIVFRMSGAMDIVGYILFGLSKILDVVALAFLYVAKGVADAFGGNQGINDQIKKLNDDLRKGYGEVAAPINAPVDPLNRLAEASTNAADSAEKVAAKYGEMLVNLPSGYKVNAARRAADNGGAGGPLSSAGDLTATAALWASSVGDILQGADYSQAANNYAGWNSGSGQSNVAEGQSGVPAMTEDEAATWAQVYAYSRATGASPADAAAAADAWVESNRSGGSGGRGSSSSAATIAPGGGGGGGTVIQIGAVHLGGARDFNDLVKKISETQEQHLTARTRNPHKRGE